MKNGISSLIRQHCIGAQAAKGSFMTSEAYAPKTREVDSHFNDESGPTGRDLPADGVSRPGFISIAPKPQRGRDFFRKDSRK